MDNEVSLGFFRHVLSGVRSSRRLGICLDRCFCDRLFFFRVSVMKSWSCCSRLLFHFADGVDDHDPLIPGTSSACPAAAVSSTKTGQQRDSDDIKAHLDKLARIAGQLSHRHADFNPVRATSPFTRPALFGLQENLRLSEQCNIERLTQMHEVHQMIASV